MLLLQLQQELCRFLTRRTPTLGGSMHFSRSAVLVAAGAVILSGTSYFLLRSPRTPGNDSMAATLEDFRIRKEAPKDASIETILAERDAIAAAARSKLAGAGIASGHETALADAFADMLTAYRQPTVDKFFQFYQSRGVSLDPAKTEPRRRVWERVSLMTDRRRVAIDSIAVSRLPRSQLASTVPGPDQFISTIRPAEALERGLSLDSIDSITCLAINVPAQERGPGSAYTLTIGFVRAGTGHWLPVMNRIEGATERPVYLLPL